MTQSVSTITDALAQKAARVDRCVERAREEHQLSADFARDFSRQDAALLNIQRACELSIDMGNMVIAQEQWGLPQSAREVFAILGQRGVLSAELVTALQRMVGFRNIAVHEYDTLDLNIVIRVITHDVDSLRQLAGLLLNRYVQAS